MRLRGGDRKYCIAGNWKMNPATLDDAKNLATEVRAPRCAAFPCRPKVEPPTVRSQIEPASPRAVPVRAWS